MKTQIKTLIFTGFALLFFSLTSCQKGKADSANQLVKEPEAKTEPLPVLNGKLVYHSYSCYGCSGTKLFIYNFATNQRQWISQNWNIDYPMNGHFNYNATKLVFMGQPAGSGDWDIYLWEVGSAQPPVNLTAGNGIRDEDPKFSPNGYRITFKQANNLKIMDLTGTITNTVTNTPNIEEGMPYYTDDATGLLFAQGSGSGSDIYKINIDGTGKTAMANVSGVQEYYPIVRNASTFLYSRWYSASNHHDQVYMGNFANNTRTRLPFNQSDAEYADGYPCGTDYVILSSTRTGTVGGYDLQIANITTGQIWSLNAYNNAINSTDDELGACYVSN